MAEVALGSKRIHLGSGLALIALSVLFIVVGESLWMQVAGWLLLGLMALFDLVG